MYLPFFSDRQIRLSSMTTEYKGAIKVIQYLTILSYFQVSMNIHESKTRLLISGFGINSTQHTLIVQMINYK
jgi:hypothetical protein